MSLYQCEKCGCCENTACSWYWGKVEKLCSACAPTTYADGSSTGFGKWHGKFDRIFLPVGMFETNSAGNLEHVETGNTDFKKYAIEQPTSPASEEGKPVEPDNYVAWLRYNFHEGNTTTIRVCDSDAEGAFKVYRRPPNTAALLAEQERKIAEQHDRIEKWCVLLNQKDTELLELRAQLSTSEAALREAQATHYEQCAQILDAYVTDLQIDIATDDPEIYKDRMIKQRSELKMNLAKYLAREIRAALADKENG